MTAPWLDDGDVRLYHGDVQQVLAGLPDESVDCVITSPPYWGLRDYGTAKWIGGDDSCDHHPRSEAELKMNLRLSEVACSRCGATRSDAQLGLEPTPDLYVQRIVAVFREVRRVLAAHGTCWVNLGDSYATAGGQQQSEAELAAEQAKGWFGDERGRYPTRATKSGRAANTAVAGLKAKNLCGIPWRVAFALQQDGWWLRSDIIWAKPNPMPESVTDRPTKSHEYLFLLTKAPRYYFDTEAVREPHSPDGRHVTTRTVGNGSHLNYQEFGHDEGRERWPNAGRNVRSVWTVATQPYPEAHFATYPEELVRRCVLAGCPERVCATCGKPSERQVDVSYEKSPVHGAGSTVGRHYETGANNFDGAGMPRVNKVTETTGWSDCGHNTWRPGTVLDPFIGSGTTAKVARDHGRHSIGIDLSEPYLKLAARRLQQLSLLTQEGGHG